MTKKQITIVSIALILVILSGVLSFTNILSGDDSISEAASLKQGSTGDLVKRVQTKLKNWGYYTGTVDGIFGPKTVEAVKYFSVATD